MNEQVDDATLAAAEKDPLAIKALVAEIQERAALSKQYKEERDEAQTKAKREHFQKKLVRNNEEAADLMIALQKLVEGDDDVDAEGNSRDPGATAETTV